MSPTLECQSPLWPWQSPLSPSSFSSEFVAAFSGYLIISSFRELRQRDVSKYHIQLSLAMLFMLIVSLALVAQSVQNVTDPYGGCVMVSILVHYFTLVAVMWMGAEALLMFQKLVIVFTRVTTKFIVYVSVICWSKCAILKRGGLHSVKCTCLSQLCPFCSSLSHSLWIWLLEIVLQKISLLVDHIVKKTSLCEYTCTQYCTAYPLVTYTPRPQGIFQRSLNIGNHSVDSKI